MGAVECEVLEALVHARAGRDFLMTGGAGSGKTYSMQGFLEEIYAETPQARVVCVTYTNVAVNEIRNRFPTPSLQVSTIHEFLWSLISRYQKNIREALVALVGEGAMKSTLDAPIDTHLWKRPISYKEWLNLAEGEISHAEVLKVALFLFAEHPTLSKILADRYDYLLVDEYQDTPVDVLKILLEVLPEPTQRSLRIGFFGDGEQAIHEGGASKELIACAKENGRLNLITKKQNRRNPASVIRVINNLRTDGLKQVQAKDRNAPNFGKEGSARFIYTEKDELDTASLKQLPICRGWSFASQDLKILYLGKSAIARENRFPRLMEIYDKDRAVEYAKKVRDRLASKGILVEDGVSFGKVLEDNQQNATMTPIVQKAFEADPHLLPFASSYSFHDLVATSSNSDKLLGTKKVSDLDDRDRGQKRDALINHLVSIEKLRSLYRDGKFNAVIRALDTSLTSIAERRRIATSLEHLEEMNCALIGEVIEYADFSGLVTRKDAVVRFQEKHPYRFARVCEVPFEEIARLYEYVEDHSPYSTQHGVKGSEWDNIFVSLDNGGWNMYNFEKLMAAPDSDGSIESRSRMMLYVTCSRAKENLLVYVHKPTLATLATAEEWFGVGNVLAVG
ncbi:UvrD-helicase domain-containing protein [Brevibacterium sp.]|uniref:UvrD-helicase domain-containing protein n=1 Tax=Brevibacterium sp. TaxID=1701 RepID=UPI002810DDFD|nr:UvrD-helicase domain-containing protein [Brevibacterium sp.]